MAFFFEDLIVKKIIDKIQKHLIFFNTVNHYFEEKYNGIEGDIEYIMKFDVTLGQQLKRLGEYEEYKILSPYMLPETIKKLVNESLLEKIETDLIALERFTFKEGEENKSAHFKDVARCLKQERFNDNIFKKDVFIYCADVEINYLNGIKLFFLKQHNILSELLSDFTEKIIQDYNDNGMVSIKENVKKLEEFGVNKKKIYYALLWSAKTNKDFHEIKNQIKDYNHEEALKTSYRFQKSDSILFEQLALNKKESWLENISINNNILSDIFYSEELTYNDKNLLEKTEKRMKRHNWLMINEINNEKLSVNIEKEWSLLKDKNLKIKGKKTDQKVIKQLFKEINLLLSPKEVKNKFSNTVFKT